MPSEGAVTSFKPAVLVRACDPKLAQALSDILNGVNSMFSAYFLVGQGNIPLFDMTFLSVVND
jgi:hypothetical protein